MKCGNTDSILGDVSIIIPAYNEEESIIKTVVELKLHEEIKNAEIIVIDDGSTDDTFIKASSVGGVRVIQHRQNKGYGSAIASGVRNSTKDYIVWYDADGQHRPEDLIKVVKALINDDLDYCIGIRNKDSHSESSRKLGKFILKIIVRIAAGQAITDFNSGLRAFKKSVIIRYLHLLPKRFGASTVTTLLMLERGYFGKEVPIVVRKRIGKSTVKQFRDGFRTISLILQIVLLFRPMEIFGYTGFLAVLCGTIYGLYQALLFRLGFPVLSAIIIIFGIQILFFGVLCDQISHIRRERMDIYKND